MAKEQNFLIWQLKKAQREDTPLLYEKIEKECFIKPLSEKLCRELVENSTVYLLFLRWEVIGYASIKYIPPEAELLRIAIRPKWQRKKFGSFLLENIEKELFEKKIEKLYLEVSEKNHQAIAFYKKWGFRLYHKRKNYYGPLEDALCLEKSLNMT